MEHRHELYRAIHDNRRRGGSAAIELKAETMIFNGGPDTETRDVKVHDLKAAER